MGEEVSRPGLVDKMLRGIDKLEELAFDSSGVSGYELDLVLEND